MRTILILLCTIWAADPLATASEARFHKSPIQCVLKNAVIKNKRSSIGTNIVFHISATVELINYSTDALDIERDSLVVALYTARLSDSNGLSWELRSPLSRYQYHPFETGQRDVIRFGRNSTNQLEMTLTSIDGPFMLINNHLLATNQTHGIPNHMFGSIFTTVLGRAEGQPSPEKIILQGAWNFGIRHESP